MNIYGTEAIASSEYAMLEHVSQSGLLVRIETDRRRRFVDPHNEARIHEVTVIAGKCNRYSELEPDSYGALGITTEAIVQVTQLMLSPGSRIPPEVPFIYRRPHNPGIKLINARCVEEISDTKLRSIAAALVKQGGSVITMAGLENVERFLGALDRSGAPGVSQIRAVSILAINAVQEL